MNTVEDSASTHPHPDYPFLRGLVCLSFVSVVIGCLVGAESNTGRWIVLISLGAGVLATLAHLLEMLTRRLRTRTAEFLGLLAAFSILLVLFSNSGALFGGVPAEGAARSHTIVPLAATLLVLLLRATVLARCSAPFLPLGLARTITLKGRGVLLKDEIVVPPRWIYALYWFSPVGWWLLGTLLIVSHTLAVESWLMLAAIGVLACALAVRTLLGLAAWIKAYKAWREAKSGDDHALAREARWNLGFNGLTLGGLVVFYAFAVAGNRFLDEAMDKLEDSRFEQVVMELVRLNPPPKLTGLSPGHLYSQAIPYDPKPGNEHIFDRAWATPGAAIHNRWCSGVLRNLPSDSSGPTEYFATPDYGLPYSEDYRQTVASDLILLERFAAEVGNWDGMTKDTRVALTMARHTRECPLLHRWELGCAIAHQSLMGLVATIFWTENFSPPDTTLEIAQKIIREHLEDRGCSLIWHAQVNALQRLESMHWSRILRDKPSGDLSFSELIKCRPISTWRKQNNFYRFTHEVLPDYEHGYLEVQRYDLLERARKFGDCDAYCDIPQELPEYVDLELKTICEFRMTDAAIAVARYKNKYHYWPQTLQDCVPEFLPLVPADPFNPKDTLKFAVEPARIYSLGHATGYHPENHGGYPFTSRVLMNDVFERDNLVLFLGNPGVFRALPDGAPELPGVDIPGEIANLKSAVVEDRRAALRRLSRVGAKAAPGVDALLPLLTDADVEQRMYAAYILGRCGVKSDAVLSALRAARLDAEADVRFFARQALRKLE